MAEENLSGAVDAEEAKTLNLPDFLGRRREGVFVDLTRLKSGKDLEITLERIYAAGFIFRDLDYARLQRLVFDFDEVREGLLEVRLGADIVLFPEERKGLYRGVKIDGETAWYVFEPVQIERVVEVPVTVVGDDGEPVDAGTEEKIIAEPASLDFDEFVADLWKKGVRFGIDEPRVRELITSGRTERAAVAHARPPTESVDAGVEEQSDALHRSNAPRRLEDGRVDLGQYANRFPQVAAGTLLLMKTPSQTGRPGHRLDGGLLEARLPQDFEMASLAGENTRIEVHDGREYLVAAIKGFLTIDAATNKISLSEKIINKDGVNARTTGNLALQGEEYEDFGDVQEGRSVEGRHLTFHANVFGRVMSTGGRILLEKNLVGGTALNRDGEIVVEGLASGAHIQLGRGLARVARAENCLIIADRVEVEWACQCTIVADEVEAAQAEGCAIAARRVHVGISRARSEEENLISMLLPDLSGIDKSVAGEESYIAECNGMISQLKQGLAAMASQPEMKDYLSMAGRLRRKEITLTREQLGDWQQTTARMAPAMKRIQQGREDIQALEAEISAAQARIAELVGEKAKAGQDVECTVDEVAGDTVVRTMILPLGEPPLARQPPKELRAKLRGPLAGQPRLYAGEQGSFAWKNQVPD